MSIIKNIDYLPKCRYRVAEELFGILESDLEHCRLLGCNIMINNHLFENEEYESTGLHLHISFTKIKENSEAMMIYNKLSERSNCRKSKVKRFITLIFHEASFLDIPIDVLERKNEQKISSRTKR